MSDQFMEIELKLRLLEPDNWEKLLASPVFIATNPQNIREEHLESCYFDTPGGALRQAGIALRTRLEPNGWVATVKAGGTSAGGLHQRREWNVPVTNVTPDIQVFKHTDIGALLAELVAGQPLTPLCATVFDRRLADITTEDGSIIEFALDRGYIAAGDNRETLTELELELKGGTPSALLALGAALAEAVPVTVEPDSKYLRALRLAGLDSGEELPEQPAIAASAPAVTALRLLITAQIHRYFTAEAAFLRDYETSDSIHRLRAILCQLSTLLTLAEPDGPSEDFAAWQSRLCSFTALTGQVHETDVILKTWREIADAGLVLDPPPWLGMTLKSERDAIASKLADELSKGQTTPLLLGLWAWVVGDNFVAISPETTLMELAVPRLAEWLETMKATGKEVDLTDNEKLDQLWIQSKKLRFTLELLPSDDRRIKLLKARLKKLQNCLGRIRDNRVITTALTAWMNRHASRVLYRDAGVLLGWSARGNKDAHTKFDIAWRKFRRASRRWLAAKKI